MGHQIGQCIQTGKQLMVRDTNGTMNSVKPDCWMAYAVMETGTRVGLILCKDAVDHPDFDTILANALDPASKCFSAASKAQLQKCGKILRLERAKRFPLAGKWVE